MSKKFQIMRIAGNLPGNLDDLRFEARQEGYSFVERLVREWEGGENCFEQVGEALMIAYEEDVVAGIGGITVDPIIPDALRMRRFYIRRSFRRRGLARLLVDGLLVSTEDLGRVITVHAGTRDAPAFWEAMGFERHDEDGHSHILPSTNS